MDQSEQTQKQQQQQQQPVVGVAAGASQVAYASAPYQTAPMVASGTPAVAVHSPTQPPTSFSNSSHQLAYQKQAQHFHHQQ